MISFSSALAIFALATSTMPSAASVSERPSGSATFSDRLLGEVAARLEAAALALGAEGRLGGDVAEHEVGVGHRRLGAAAVVAGRARAAEPALCGPTRRPPPSSSIQAIEPPPAPIEIDLDRGDAVAPLAEQRCRRRRAARRP